MLGDENRSPGALNLTTPGRDRTTSLVIDWLELTDFKSYAGCVKIGPFHERFTAIIGPNGSGKSNIIDALLFVFGRKALQLRQKKLAQLIHSSARHRPEKAKVTVIFATSTQVPREKPPDGGQMFATKQEVTRTYAFKLSREVFINGTSKYYIEDRPANHQEMVDFVKSKGIDLNHNRFLILQGEVEQLSMLPPKGKTVPAESANQPVKTSGSPGLLEMLEDLIGSNEFLDQISDAEFVYNELKQALEESDERLYKGENEMNGLLGPYREAYSYVKGHKRLLISRILLELKQKGLIDSDIANKQSELKEVVDKISENQSAITEKAKDLDVARVNLTKHDKLHEQLYLKIKTLKDKVKGFELEEDRVHTILKTKKQRIKSLQSELEKLADELKSQTALSVDIIKEAENGEQRLKDLTVELRANEEQLASVDESVKDEHERLLQVINERTREKQRLDEVLKSHQTKLAELTALIKIKIRVRDDDSKIQALKTLKEQISTLKRKLKDDILGQIDARNKEREQSEQKLKQLLEIVKQTHERKAKLDKTIEELEEKRRAPQVGSASASNLLSMALRKEFARGTLNGFMLLDYLECEDLEKYGTALTAAGLNDDIVITRSDDDSEKIIRYVREHRLGRVTCVNAFTSSTRWSPIMANWAKKVADQNFAARKCVPLARIVSIKAEAIAAEEDKREQRLGGSQGKRITGELLVPVLWSRLRDTLLSLGSIADAKTLAFGGKERNKVVTLKGEVIEKNGSMTGGHCMNFLKQRTVIPAASSAHPGESKEAIEQKLRKVQSDLNTLIVDLRTHANHQTTLEQQIAEAKRFVAQSVEEGKEYEKMIVEMRGLYQKNLAEYEAEQQAQKTAARAKAEPAQVALVRKYMLADIDSNVSAQEIEEAKNLASSKLDIESLTEIQRALKSRETEAASKVAKVAAELTERNKTLKALGGVAREQLIGAKKSMEAEVARLTKLTTSAVEISSKAKRRAEQIEAQIVPQTNKTIEEESAQVASNNERLGKIEEEITTLNKQVNEFSEELNKMEEEHSELKSAKSAIESQIKAQENQNKSYKEIADDFSDVIGGLSKTQATKAKLIQQYKADFKQLPVAPAEDSGTKSQETKEEMVAEVPPDAGDGDVVMMIADENEKPAPPAESSQLAELPTTGSVVDDLEEIDEIDRLAGQWLEAQEMREMQLLVYKREQEVRSMGTTMLDVTIISKYQEKSQEVAALRSERNRRREDAEAKLRLLQSLKGQRRAMFDKGFEFLSEKIKELYQMLTRGGDAELEFKDCNSPFTEGIEYSVRPPGKSWRTIHNLSGGEKTLSSLALIFALHHYRPTPVYFLDEIDAALDTNNVLLIASYVAAFQANNAQFVVISLRHEFFQRADRLVGVCKVYDQTKICVIDPDEFALSVPTRKRGAEEALEDVPPLLLASVSRAAAAED